jgi:hypothetical protein
MLGINWRTMQSLSGFSDRNFREFRGISDE